MLGGDSILPALAQATSREAPDECAPPSVGRAVGGRPSGVPPEAGFRTDGRDRDPHAVQEGSRGEVGHSVAWGQLSESEKIQTLLLIIAIENLRAATAPPGRLAGIVTRAAVSMMLGSPRSPAL